MNPDIVILLHGILRTKRSMRALETALVQDGYQVINIDYPSRKLTVTELADYVLAEINRHAQNSEQRLHFVGHSMGCLIIRQLLASQRLSNVGNTVMLGPPNQGSEVADFLAPNFLYRWIYGPAGLQLTTHFAKQSPFPDMQFPFGVIAGNLCLDPICYFILPTDHDGKVTIESTKLAGMRDHIVLPCSHSFMMSNQQVIEQVKYFLKHGRFKDDKIPPL